MKELARIAVSFTALMLAGCAYGSGGGQIGETGLVQVVNTESLPAPSTVDIVGTGRAYVVGPQDVLTIDVMGLQEITARDVVVDSAGRLSLPLAGTINAAGYTPEQLAAVITDRLEANYMRNPLVSVNVKEMTSQFLTVEGQVLQPGNYPVLNDMTLLRAVASAKGLGEFAKVDDVVVLRTVEGNRYAGVYNLAAIRRGNYPDPQVYANDVVIVGDSVALRRMRDLITVLPALTSPLIYLLDNN